MDIGRDLLARGTGDLSLRGVVAAGKELEEAGEAGFAGDASVPVICAFLLGVSTAGASHKSISSQKSSSSMRKMSGAVGVASVTAAVVPSEVQSEGFPSPQSHCVEFWSSPPPSLGLPTLVDCAGASAVDPDTDVLGIS